MSGGFVWHVFAIWVRVWRFGFKDARQPDRAGHPGAPGPGRARPLRARPRTASSTADLGDRLPAERGCLQTKLRLTSDETDNELKTLTRLRTNLRPPTRVSLSD